MQSGERLEGITIFTLLRIKLKKKEGHMELIKQLIVLNSWPGEYRWRAHRGIQSDAANVRYTQVRKDSNNLIGSVLLQRIAPN